jgi:hypothetical protein
MKITRRLRLAACLSLAGASLHAEDLSFVPPDPNPKTWLERIELAPGRPFDCLMVETIPGVSYVIETSDDLIQWERLGEPHLGLGHEIVTPMIERTQIPEPENPEPDPSPPPPPAKSVSLLLRPATTGGLVVSFQSLDSAGPLVHHFPDLEMSPDWQQMPLYVSPYLSGHAFAIWHPGTPQAPPAGPVPLGTEDQIMLEVFEEHFEEMDLEIQASVVRSRSLPPPPPSAPGSKRFYRVTGDAGVDTDDDGTPNWLEFALAAAGGQYASTANPFDADTDGNGTPDGQQSDADDDGIPDAEDVAPGDGAIRWQKSEHPLFAFFPVSGTGPVAHVNDQGRVLYRESVWHNGAPVALNPSSGTLLTGCHAIGIGDNGFILGIGEIDPPDDTGESRTHCMVTWPVGGGDPVPLRAGEKYLIPVAVAEPGVGATFPQPSDMNVNPDGKFVAYVGKLVSGPGSGGLYSTVQVDGDEEEPRKIWQGTAGNPAVTEVSSAGIQTVWIAADGLECGADDLGRFKAGEHVFNGPYRRVAPLPGGGVGAFASGGLNPFVLDAADSTWKPNGTLASAVDISAEGRFALRHPWSIWLNGQDTRLGHEMAPGLPAAWQEGGTTFADTTRHGWTLALKDGDPPAAMLGLPLRLSTDTAASGLDNQSAAASDSIVHPATLRAGNKDEFWIMVPAGGTTTVRVKSTASATVPLLIDQGGLVTTDPTSLTGPDQTITLSAAAAAAGQEFALPLKIGAVPSASIPIRVKVMKPRVVNVSIWPLKRPNFTETNPPSNLPPLPTEQEIEDYLNEVYQPQIAVTFNVTLKAESEMAADPGTSFDPVTIPQATLDALTAGKAGGNIQVFVTGGYSDIGTPGAPLGQPDFLLGGWTPTGGSQLWLPVGALIGGGVAGKEKWLNSLAHETGHVFWGPGHPNDRKVPGKAGLPGTDLNRRLMVTFQGNGAPPKLVVKAEWDEADNWLETNVDSEE